MPEVPLFVMQSPDKKFVRGKYVEIDGRKVPWSDYEKLLDGRIIIRNGKYVSAEREDIAPDIMEDVF